MSPEHNSPEGNVSEKRRFQRVRVSLLGRCMFESQREYPCRTIEMSPGGMLVYSVATPRLGEKIVVYLRELGRFEGVVVRWHATGFAMSFSLSRQKRVKLADQLIWFANRHLLRASEARQHERIVPLKRMALMRSLDGRERIVTIRDVSPSSVSIETMHRPHLFTRVEIGHTPIIVARHFDNGIIGNFLTPFPQHEMNEMMTL
jgi:hypothetical protein